MWAYVDDINDSHRFSEILVYLRIGRILEVLILIRYKSSNFPQLFFFIYLQISNYRTHMCEPSGTHVSSMQICEPAVFPLLKKTFTEENSKNPSKVSKKFGAFFYR